MANALIPNILKAVPVLHGFVKAFINDELQRLQAFDNAALAGAVIADQNRERRQLYHAAILHGFEVFYP
jgi:hypothetical protein